MNYVAPSINHGVSIVPVLDLEDVTCDRVRSHLLDDVQPGLLEGNCVLSAIFANKEIEQVINFGLPHLIS